MTERTHEIRFVENSAAPLWLCALLAVGMHAGILVFWKSAPAPPVLLEVEGDSVEVALVESAPDSPAPLPPAAEPVPTPPEPVVPPVEPTTPPPEPMPEPAPEPPPTPAKEPEMVIPPEPPKPTPAPRPVARKPEPPQRPVQKPPPQKPPVVTAAGGTGNGTVAAKPGTAAGSGAGAGAPKGRPSFATRPSPVYPAESRAAGEHGVVMVKITVNADGRPTAVSVAKSSGFPRLDRAAVESGWRCRVTNAPPGAQLTAPIRFSLER